MGQTTSSAGSRPLPESGRDGAPSIYDANHASSGDLDLSGEGDGRCGSCPVGCLPSLSLPFLKGAASAPAFEEVAQRELSDDESSTHSFSGSRLGLLDESDTAVVVVDRDGTPDLSVPDSTEPESARDDEGRPSSAAAVGGGAPPCPPALLDRLVAVDCGMVSDAEPGSKKRRRRRRRAGKGKPKNEPQLALRRVCLVDGRGRTLLNAVVRVPPPSSAGGAGDPPSDAFADGGRGGGGRRSRYESPAARYLSKFLPRINSSLDDLEAGISPVEAKRRAASAVRGKIVVGHSVSNDLRALGLLGSHPTDMVRDTALYPPFRRRPKDGCRKLSVLVKERLGRDIQPNGKFHCCTEDAVAALDLYKSVWKEWEDSIAGSTVMEDSIAESSAKSREALPSESEKNDERAAIPPKPGRAKKKRKKKKKGKKRKRQLRVLALSVLATLDSGVELLLSGVELVLSPLFMTQRFLVRVTHDFSHLARDVVLLSWRAGKLRCGFLVTPPPARAILTSKQKRKRRLKRARQLFSFADCAMLTSHVLLELLTVAAFLSASLESESSALASVVEPRESSPFLCERRNLRIAVAMALVGISLLVAESRNTRQSALCFGVLAHHRSVGVRWKELRWASAGSFDDVGRLSATKLSLARFLRWDPNATIQERVEGVKNFMVKGDFGPSVFSLLQISLLCWFALRFGNFFKLQIR